MKKLFVILLTLIASVQNFYGQCYPVFSQMPKQRLNSLPFPGEVGYNHTFFYAVSGFDYMTYDIWDGKNWDFIKLPADTEIPKTGGFGLAKLNNTYVAFGKISYFNNMRAPQGKYFGFIRYKNGVWDTLPGCLVDSLNYYTNNSIISASSTDKYMYAVQRISGSRGYIFRYDTTVGQFTKIADFDEGFNLSIKVGANRLLISGIVKINGMITNGFATIDGDSIKTNSNKAFKDNMFYGIDKSNDHVYAYSRDTNPIVLEYSNQLIQTRNSKSDIFLNGIPNVHDGRIMCFDRVLCPGETIWKKASLNDAVNIVSTKDGLFGLHAQSRKVLELTTGAQISGIAFLDLDSNCIQDTINEPVLKKKEISAISAKFMARTTTDTNGKFEFYVTLDSFQINGPGPSAACANKKVIVTSLGKEYFKDIPVLKPSKYDLSIKLLNGHFVRWNSNVAYTAQVENLGLPYDSAYYEFNLDPKLKFIAGDSNMNYVSGSTIRGQLKNLDYFDKRNITVFAWVDSSKTKPDSILCSNFSSYLYTTENNMTNNSDEICQEVVYSLDPNHKNCNQDIIPKSVSTPLDYYIAFQNEGNDYAEDVVIIDSLSPMLTLETLQIIGASHPYTATLDGSVLTVTFKQINLKPKKENDLLSQGFIKYNIKTIAGLKRGDKINNTAYIYFDLNKPVITNTSVVIVEKDIASVNQPTSYKNTLQVYPNPAQNVLHVKTSNSAVIQVYSVNGALLTTGIPENRVLDIDISTWPVGLYLIRSGNLYSKVLKTE